MLRVQPDVPQTRAMDVPSVEAAADAVPFDFSPYLSSVGGVAGIANVIMQLALPGVGYGVIESTVESGQATRHPFKRTRTTFTYLSVAMLGTADDKVAYREAVNTSHRHVRSREGSGAKYNAFDPSLQLWVTACLYRGFLDVAEWIQPDMSEAAKDELYAASSVLGTTLQMRAADWPENREAFASYWDSMVRDRIRIDAPVREYLLDLMALKNFPLPLRLAFGRVNHFVTTGWLPPEFRDQMGLTWTPRDQRRWSRLHAGLRLIDLAQPLPIRRLSWTVWLWDLRFRRRFGLKLV